MSKSILIDATHYHSPLSTGVENYVSSLLPFLTPILQEKGWSVSWMGHQPQAPQDLPAEVQWVASPPQRFWSQTGLAATLRFHKPDLYFTPSGLTPVRYLGPTAITIQDMGAYLFPEAYTFPERFRLRTLAKRNAQQATLLLTPSEYSKKQIIHFWNIPSERIRVTPLGYQPFSGKSEPLSHFEPQEPFILFLGRIEKKKNIEPLLQGFIKLAEVQPGALVLAGKPGYGYKGLLNTINKLPLDLRSRVILPGYVSEAQKEWLLQKAFTLVMPCRQEGFGLPVLEGFAHNLPVIVAQAGALPEVAGPAALYAQADIATDWYLQMQRLFKEPDLIATLTELGKKRIKEYTWQATARLTAEAFLTS